jgi:hypothetical protein
MKIAKGCIWRLAGTAVLLAGSSCAIPPDVDSPVEQTPPPRATESLRRQQARLADSLDLFLPLIRDLFKGSPGRDAEIVVAAVDFLRGTVQAQGRAEEKYLYPAAERHAPGECFLLLLVLKSEHRVMERWIDEIEDLGEEPFTDRGPFDRRCEELVALARLHLRNEEVGLLPVLDRVMTPAQFRSEVGRGMGLEP